MQIISSFSNRFMIGICLMLITLNVNVSHSAEVASTDIEIGEYFFININSSTKFSSNDILMVAKYLFRSSPHYEVSSADLGKR